jgi:hypothetical protein
MNQDINTPLQPTPPDELSFPDTEQNIVTPQPSHQMQPTHSESSTLIHRKTLLAGIIPSAIAVLLIASFIGWRIMSSQNNSELVQNNTAPTTNVDLNGLELSLDKLSSADELLVNGDLVVNSTLVLSPQEEPTNPQTGQIYYDSTEKVARVYDGSGFRKLIAAENNDNVCFVNGDCGFPTNATVNTLNTRLADSQTEIARLVGQINNLQGLQTATDLSGINASIAQLQSQVAAIPPTPSLASYFQNGGNSFGTTATLGTSTNNSLNLLTNNQTRATISNTGNLAVDTNTLFVDATNNRVGVGTTTPTGTFEVLGNSVLNGTTTTGDLIPLTPGSTTLGFVSSDVLTINNQSSVYNDSQKFIAMGLDNLPRFVYFDNSYQDVHYVRCLDEDCVTKNDTLISTNPDGQDAPTLKIGSDGLARIVYINWSDPQEIHYVQCLNDDCTSRNDNVVDSQSSSPFYEISFALDASDNAQIVYNNYSTNEVSLAQCVNADCSSVNLTAVTGFSYGSTYGIEVGQDGFARIAYYDNNEVLYISCNNLDCSVNSIEAAATGLLGSSYYVDLVLDSNELARIAYSDRNGSGLKLITCQNDTCSSSTSTILVPPPYERQVSLSIDSGDSVRIAYAIEPFGLGLNYIYCNNQDCSSNTTTNIDVVGGYPISLAVGSNDLSTILYADDEVIKLARLNTADGQDNSVYGTAIGSNTSYFGQSYMQGLNIQAASSSGLLSLENISTNGSLIDFKVSGTKIGSLGVTGDTIEIRNSTGTSLLGVNTSTSSVTVSGDLNLDNGNLNLDGNATITSTSDSASAFTVQDSSGTSVLNVNTKSKSLTVGSPVDSEEFFTSARILTVSTPYFVATADFNVDGKLDMVAANFTQGSVSVFLSNGDGTFAPKVDYVAGTTTRSVTTSDFNNDGYPDLAAANSSSNTVSVFFNNGDGTFAAKVDYISGSSPMYVNTGDFNNDGNNDIATANSSRVSVFLNNGDGTFAAKVDYVVGSGAGSVAISDLNNDTYVDLAVGNESSRNISILLNNGDGTFAPKVDYATGSQTRSVATTDLNNDGNQDLVGANWTSNTISIFLNNGDGTFAPKFDYPTSPSPFYVTTGDLDGDGTHEIIVPDTISSVTIFKRKTLSFYSSPVVRLYTSGNDALQAEGLGNKQIFRVDGQGSTTIGGTGSVSKDIFGSKVDYPTGSNPQIVTSADLDGDGDIDLATANGGSSNVSILLNNGNGTYAPRVDYSSGNTTYSITSADLDGDGDIDLVTTNYNSATVSVLFNNSNGTFAPRVIYSTGIEPSSITAVDFDDDGYIDLAVTNGSSNTISILFNNSNGTFAPKIDYSVGSAPVSASADDFDGDGDIDIVVANAYVDYISVLLNNGDGTFAPKVDFPITAASYPTSITSADLDGDGDIDLAVSTLYSKTVSVLLNNGDGTFAPKVDFPTGLDFTQKIISTDLDRDGYIDLVVVSSQANYVSILSNNGDGTFAPKVDFPTGQFSKSVTASDFNGDGYPDLATASAGSSTVSIFINLHGSFTTTGRLTVYDTAGSSQILNLGLTGNLNLQNTVNSTSAFSINNAAGSNLFNVDTLNSRISITSRTNSNLALTVNNSSNQSVFTVDTLNSSANIQSRTDNASAFAVQNSAGAPVLSVNTLTSTLTVNGKITTANISGTTTVASGANAGAGATVSVVGNDTSGTVTITTGTGSVAGILATVTFSSAYTATPRIVMTPANANGSTLQYFYSATTGNFTIRTNNAPVDATQYQFTYWAVQ